MANIITNGAEGEQPIFEAMLEQNDGTKIGVRQLPDDPQGILRISIGGDDKIVYFVFRGDREKCIAQIQKALDAIEMLDRLARAAQS